MIENKLAREKAYQFLMTNSSMYRILHSPREMAGCAVSAIVLAGVICWAISYV
jgi:hypothetical protein